MAGSFLQYHEPDIVQLLVLLSFFAALTVSGWVSERLVRSDLIGHIAVGIVYGKPLADILLQEWQETFLALGYLGLILIIFEGGLSARLDLLKKNILLSLCAAATGVIVPIGLSMALLMLGYGYGAVESFILGAALSATSLGTTFSVLASTASTVDLNNSRVGAVLISAAVIDDATGLVMLSTISRLGGEISNLGWTIGRPIVAAGAMTILTPVLGKYAFTPFYRSFLLDRISRYSHIGPMAIMLLALCAFLAIAAYAGTSVLYGAFLAGAFLSYIDDRKGSAVNAERSSTSLSDKIETKEVRHVPAFVKIFDEHLALILHYFLAPVFFASIGFAIPFVRLWTGKAIWQGILYAALMLFGKVIVGSWIFIWSAMPAKNSSSSETAEAVEDEDEKLESGNHDMVDNSTSALSVWWPAILLGFAMVARGEIGLLIVEIGYTETSYVSEAALITAVWAIVLNTIVGPIAVGLVVKYKGGEIVRGAWGAQ